MISSKNISISNEPFEKIIDKMIKVVSEYNHAKYKHVLVCTIIEQHKIIAELRKRKCRNSFVTATLSNFSTKQRFNPEEQYFYYMYNNINSLTDWEQKWVIQSKSTFFIFDKKIPDADRPMYNYMKENCIEELV